jgi:hypothetical protein
VGADIHTEGTKHRATLRSASIALFAASATLVCGAFLAAGARSDNPSGDDLVGSIEGDAIALQGPMTVEVVRGQIKTMLRSGNDIRVKSGLARLDLVEGGQIAICGPAHLSVLKSGGSLTLALDTGVIHAHIENKPALTVYTAQIQAKPIAIGGGAQDALIGFQSPGTMCVKATSGAIRLEQQLTAQNVIVPQGGDVLVNDGRLESLQNTSGHCSCEVQIAAKETQRPPEVSRIATPQEIQERDAQPKAAQPEEKRPTQKVEPVYQVYMPPLSYDAKAAVQQDDFDPKLILLVRRVRVRPTLIFQGRVEEPPAPVGQPALAGGTATASSAAPSKNPKAASATSTAAAPPAQDDGSVVNRVRAFFRRLFS